MMVNHALAFARHGEDDHLLGVAAHHAIEVTRQATLVEELLDPVLRLTDSPVTIGSHAVSNPRCRPPRILHGVR